MGITPPLRYIHIDDYAPCGIDNGPDDAAFANARADLAAFGYHMLVVGTKQYWRMGVPGGRKGGASRPQGSESKVFFSEEKKQKTLANSGVCAA